MTYGPRSTGPARPGRAPVEGRKKWKRNENNQIQASKPKTIRTGLKILKQRRIVHPNRTSIGKVRFLAGSSQIDTHMLGDFAINLERKGNSKNITDRLHSGIWEVEISGTVKLRALGTIYPPLWVEISPYWDQK